MPGEVWQDLCVCTTVCHKMTSTTGSFCQSILFHRNTFPIPMLNSGVVRNMAWWLFDVKKCMWTHSWNYNSETLVWIWRLTFWLLWCYRIQTFLIELNFSSLCAQSVCATTEEQYNRCVMGLDAVCAAMASWGRDATAVNKDTTLSQVATVRDNYNGKHYLYLYTDLILSHWCDVKTLTLFERKCKILGLWWSTVICLVSLACLCDGAGVADIACTPTGHCICLPNYLGQNCDDCAPGYYGYPDCAGEYHWPLINMK